jgi:ferric-dicitrate binding protein FerR (iron transport regulator)
MNRNDKADLMLRYLDGASDGDDGARLDELLKSDPEAAGLLRDLALQHVTLLRIVRCAAPAGAVGRRTRSRRFLRHLGLATAAAAAAVVCTVGLMWWWEQKPEAGTERPGAAVLVAQGECSVESPAESGRRADLQKDAILRPGDIVRTGGTGRVRFAYVGEWTWVELSSGARLELGSDARSGGKQLRLERGTVRAAVAPQRGGRAMIVTTPHALVRVLGTRLSVRAHAAETRVDISRGRARVAARSGGEDVLLREGRYAVVGEGRRPSVSWMARQELSRLWTAHTLVLPRDIRIAGSIAFDGSMLWVLARWPYRLFRIDPWTGRIERRLRVDEACAGSKYLAYGDSRLWTIAPGWPGSIRALDPETGLLAGTLEIPHRGIVRGLTFGDGSLWIAVQRHPELLIYRMNSNDGSSRVALKVGGPAMLIGMAYADGALWLDHWRKLKKYDAEDGSLLLELPQLGWGDIAGHADHELWALRRKPGTVSLVNLPRE